MTPIYRDSHGIRAHEAANGHVYIVEAGYTLVNLYFQKGPVAVNGVNGVTNEVLVAILIDRLQHLDHLLPCSENTEALNALKQAQDALHRRTANRQTRGVEGTLQP